MTHISGEDRLRYHRQLLLPQIGEQGQEKLRAAKVLIVGAGGLGSPAALYLAAAGVGAIGIVDSDVVELSNLQRQILHSTASLGADKTASAAEHLAALNPGVAVQPLPVRLDASNVDGILQQYDIALGCVDNFAARYALNQACKRQGKANIFGSAARFEGQASVFCLPHTPCYQCFFRDPPPADYTPQPDEMAVFGTTPGIIGCIQATETVKILLSIGKPLSGRLLLLDSLTMNFREIPIRPAPDCPVCNQNKEHNGPER